MDTLLGKLLEVIVDPVIVVIIVASGLTIGTLWRLFSKQHEFIKERVDLLREENRELREQVEKLRTENERLKNLSNQIQAVVVTLREQSSVTETALDRMISVEQRLLPKLESSLAYVAEQSHLSHLQLTSAVIDMKDVFLKQNFGRQEVAALAELVETVADASHHSARRLEEVAKEAKRIREEIESKGSHSLEPKMNNESQRGP